MVVLQSGTSDPDCKILAHLCSLAVDYPKNGNPVDMYGAYHSTYTNSSKTILIVTVRLNG